jgi:chromosome segregation ATPase
METKMYEKDEKLKILENNNKDYDKINILYNEAHSENETLKQKLQYIQKSDTEIEKVSFKNLDLIEEIKDKSEKYEKEKKNLTLKIEDLENTLKERNNKINDMINSNLISKKEMTQIQEN